MHINRNTINAYYNEIREKILQYSLKEQEKELGEFELDERVTLERVEFEAKEGVAQLVKHQFFGY